MAGKIVFLDIDMTLVGRKGTIPEFAVSAVRAARAAGNRTQGVGIHFPKDEKSRQLRLKIEEILGTALGSDRSTQTL